MLGSMVEMRNVSKVSVTFFCSSQNLQNPSSLAGIIVTILQWCEPMKAGKRLKGNKLDMNTAGIIFFLLKR